MLRDLPGLPKSLIDENGPNFVANVMQAVTVCHCHHFLANTHVLSASSTGTSSKCTPCQDGPHVITNIVGATTYESAAVADPTTPVGRYHVSDLTLFVPETIPTSTVVPLSRSGRPHKAPATQLNSNVYMPTTVSYVQRGCNVADTCS